jgi:sortase A
MTFTTEPRLFPTRIQRLLRWCQRLFFMTGILALGYVGFTLLDAKLYQVSAKRSLDTQIQVETIHNPTLPKSKVKPGDVLGRIDIPRLGMSIAVLQGTTWRMLRLGAGHIESTPLPGEPGNVAIAGHRDTFFRGLKDIRTNDEIQLQTATGLFRYQVDWVKVVAPDDIGVLAPSPESALTLVTCYPFYFLGSAPRRFVVRAHQY